MKYLSVLILTFLFTSSCCGTQKLIENHTDKTEDVVDNEIVDMVIPLPPKPPKESSNYKETMHQRWNTILQKHVSVNGNVDYKAIKNDRIEFDVYIDYLSDNAPDDTWTKDEKLAYWINAYNALTVDLILRNYPTKSIKDIKDPWDQRLWKVGNKWQNLNDIEHEILRKMNEPRIHFAIVCASVSCPKLQNTAFTASKLDEQLTDATKEFLADSSRNELSKDHIKISKIFKWFKKDFENNGSLIDFLNQYSDVTISESAKQSYKDYDWNLNE